MTYERYSQRGRESYSARPGDEINATDEVLRGAQGAVNETRQQAASGLDAIGDAAAAAAEDLREHHQEGLSRYVSEIADSVSAIAGSLRHKSVDELIHEVGSVARRNPTLFLAGSLAVGLGIGRLARASAKHQSAQDQSFESQRGSDYPRNLSGDGYPERAGNDDFQNVTEEDYLADDFAFAGGEDIDLDNAEFDGGEAAENFNSSGAEITSKNTKRDFSPDSGASSWDRSTLGTASSDRAATNNSQSSANKSSGNTNQNRGNLNQPIGGDFYE